MEILLEGYSAENCVRVLDKMALARNLMAVLHLNSDTEK